MHHADFVGQYLFGSSGNGEGVVYIMQTMLVVYFCLVCRGMMKGWFMLCRPCWSISGLLGKVEGLVYIMQTLLVDICLVCWGRIKGCFTSCRHCWSVYIWFVGER